MKRTICLMMLAAALTAGQAFAEGTAISGDGGYFEENVEWDGNLNVVGDATGLSVTVAAGEANLSGCSVYGAFVTGDNATNNRVLMTGGEVQLLVGSAANYGDGGNVSGNKVILTGGKVRSITAGENYNPGGTLSNNHAIIAGGIIGDGAEGHIWGGYTESDSGVTSVTGNRVSLVGNGASILVDGKTYQGHALTINAKIVAGFSNGSDNALDIYGKDISLSGGGISGTQIMNFYLVDGLADNAAMLTYTGNSLDLTGITTIGFNGSAVTNWAAYDGKSIMLIESANVQITGVGADTEVEIMGADGTAVATATLASTLNGKALSLTNIQSKGTPTPEPTTGTLSLLALCALAARRRRK